jgi:hypothetical protein
MNLFLDPSLNELRNLISEGDQSKTVHSIVVDYDGEVLIDPDSKDPSLDPNRFKFHMQLYSLPKQYINRGGKWMKKILMKLLDGWNNNMGDYSNRTAVN